MKTKKLFKKTSIIITSLLMVLTTININGIKDVNAASLYAEATSSVAKSISVDVWDHSSSSYYLELGNTKGFCLDLGKSFKSNYQFAKTGSVTQNNIVQAMNYYYADPTEYKYWIAQTLIWGYKLGKISSPIDGKNFQPGLGNIYNAGNEVLAVMNAAGVPLSPGYGALGQIGVTLEEVEATSSSGSYNLFDSGKSGWQQIATKTPGTPIPLEGDEITSTKTYKTTETIKAKVNKTDVDTSGKLSGVTFDFYQDNIKGGSATTDNNGHAEHIFTTEFSKTASATKEYCVDYDDLSIPNQEMARNEYEYTSVEAAKAAADAEALDKAKELAEAGSGQEHTYKVVETSTKTNYWLNPATNTYEKKLTGAGTVTFDITNKRQQGSITITKRDSETNNLVDNAIYGLYARSSIIHPDGTTGIVFNKDQLVATFPGTAANGTSKLSGLYLGQYYVKEITAPSGYLHSSEVYNVDLTYAGQNVEITDSSTTVKDKVQRAKVTSIKQDKELDNGSKNSDIFDFNKDGAQGDATRVGAVYGLYARENITHADGSTGVVTYNQIADSIHEIKAAKGTELSVKNVQATTRTLLATIKTDSNGEFGFDHLYNGKYYIKEITPSEGYTLDPTEYDVNLSYSNQNEQVVIKSNKVLEQVKKQAFDLFKAGHVPGTSTNAKPLAGVEFTVWLESDIQAFINKGKTLVEAKALAPVYDKLVTANDGTASSIELPFGKFRVSETKAAPDYATADDFYVTVTEDSRIHQSFTNNVIIDEKFTGLIQAIKLDKETGKQVKLEGAEFKIKNLDKNEYIGYWEWLPFPHYVSSWTTNSDGYVRLQEEFEAGNYQLEEIHAPEGYVLDTTPIPFKITNDQMYEIAEDGKTPIIKAYKSDVSTKGKIEITKQGEVLTAYDQDTKQFVYESRGLKDAEYYIFAREDILDPSNDKSVLYAKDELVTTVKTGEDGKATSKELPLGNYYSKEKVAPYGYTLSDEVKEFLLEYEDETVAIVYDQDTYINDRQKVSVEASKQDADSKEYLPGAEISLYANRDVYNYDGEIIVNHDTLLETVKTGENGKATFKTDLPNDITPEYAVMPIDEFDDVDPGFTNNVVDGVKLIGNPNSLFVVKETKEPDGYLKYAVNYYIDTKYTNQNESTLKFETPFQNEKTTTKFKKTDVAGKEIPGAKLTLKDANGKTIDSWVSAEKDHIVRGLIYDHEYTLTEDLAPLGYSIANSITFIYSEKLETVKMTDKQVEVTKIDKVTKKVLPGAKLQVIDAETKEIVDSWVTTKEKHYINNLIDGRNYILQEVEAPKGFDKEKDIPFTVIAGENQSIIMGDDTYVNIYKVDSKSNELVANAKLQIIDKETNEVVKEFVSNGKVEHITGLTVGKTYIIHELEQPEGYYINKEDLEFVVGENTEVYFYNNPILTDIMADKRDSQTMKPVISKKFAFTIYSDPECLNPIATVYADEKTGTATFKDVRYGIWYIKETAAPEGYKLSDEVKKVVVDDNLEGVGDLYSFVYLNTLLPTTIIRTEDITMISSFVILALGSSVGICLSRKKKKEIVDDE